MINGNELIKFKTKEAILSNIKNKEWDVILQGICNVKDNLIIMDYTYFKLFATNATYDLITNTLLNTIKYVIEKYGILVIHANMKGLSILELEKHRVWFKNICIVAQHKFPDTLQKCYVYNSPFLFSKLIHIISIFVDKDTIKKISLVPSY